MGFNKTQWRGGVGVQKQLGHTMDANVELAATIMQLQNPIDGGYVHTKTSLKGLTLSRFRKC